MIHIVLKVFILTLALFVLQVHQSEQVPQAGSRAPSGLPGERASVQGPGTAPRTDAVGGPWGGLLQVRLQHVLS